MKYTTLFVLSLAFISCTKEEIYPTPCNGDCETSYEVIYKNQTLYPNNGYMKLNGMI